MKRKRLDGRFINLESFDFRPNTRDADIYYIQQNPNSPFGFLITSGRLALRSEKIIPTDGFQIDGATIPRIAWRVVGPPLGFGTKANYGPAAALHDWLYEMGTAGSVTISRREADKIMLVAMRLLRVSMWRRSFMYMALRVGGGPHWRKHRRGL